MLEGRARLTASFLRFARDRHRTAPGREPRLSMTIGAYARDHRVIAVPAPGDVIDLGTAELQPLADAPRPATVIRRGPLHRGTGSSGHRRCCQAGRIDQPGTGAPAG